MENIGEKKVADNAHERTMDYIIKLTLPSAEHDK